MTSPGFLPRSLQPTSHWVVRWLHWLHLFHLSHWLYSLHFVTLVTFVSLVTFVTLATFVTFVMLVTFVTFVTLVTFVSLVKLVTFVAGNELTLLQCRKLNPTFQPMMRGEQTHKVTHPRPQRHAETLSRSHSLAFKAVRPSFRFFF